MVAYGFDMDAAVRHCVNPSSIAHLAGEDRVAELLAQGCDYRQIAEICRYSGRATANAQVQRLRKRMGWQAQ